MDGRYDLRHTLLLPWTGRSVTWCRDPGSRRRPDDLGEPEYELRLKVTGAGTVSLCPSLTTWDWTIIVKKCMATNWSMDRSALALLSSDQDRKPQASSGKHQAPRRKRQASSRKRQAPGSANHGKVSSTSDHGPGQV